MILIFTSTGDNLNARLDSRFGRAEKFIIYNTENKNFEVSNNEQNLNSSQGAGIQAAQKIVDLGANCLITGNCGPKAFQVLSMANVKIYTTNASYISEALEEFQSGKLVPLTSANKEGHW